MKRLITTGALISMLCTTMVSAQYNQTRGTVLGGLTGAAAGAIIGENSDEAGAGAAIGGVVGAVAGGLLGKAEDANSRYQYAAQQQRIYQQQQYQAAQAAQYAAQSISVHDVVSMKQSGVSDSVIASTIQQRGVRQRLEVADIVYLSQNGVGDSVIHLMQQGGAPTTVVATAPVRTVTPVIATRPAPPVVIQYRSGYPGGYRGPSRGYYGRPPSHARHRGGYYR